MTIDPTKLKDFLTHSVQHSHNPESFRSQLELQMASFMKAQQQRVKQTQSKARLQQIIEQDLRKRRLLGQKLQKKIKQSTENRNLQLKEYSKNIADVRMYKEKILSEKAKQKRKQQMEQTFLKLASIEKEQEASRMRRMAPTIARSRSQMALPRNVRCQLKQEADTLAYQSLVNDVHQRNAFKGPHQAINHLYSLRAAKARSLDKIQQSEQADKLGACLGKIQQARQRKEAMLTERSKRLQQADKYQKQLHCSRRREMDIQDSKQRQSQIKRQASKIKRAQSLQNVYLTQEGKQTSRITKIIEESPSRSKEGQGYRQQIRDCIKQFIKQDRSKN